MTGDQLKRWRENRSLTQDQLAAFLGAGWTRQRVANVELDRTSMADDIEALLAAADQALQREPSPNAKQSPKHVPGSKRRYLDLAGNPLPFDRLPATLDACYWQYGWRDAGGDDYFNLMQVGYHKQKLRGLCTPISLNAATWRVGAFVMTDNEAVQEAIPKLQARIDAGRAAAFGAL